MGRLPCRLRPRAPSGVEGGVRLRSITIAVLVLSVIPLAVVFAAPRKKPGAGHILFTGGDRGPVVFSHRRHGKGHAGYACAACHPRMEQKQGGVTMDAIRGGGACGACHDGKTRAPKGGGVAFAITECGGCHMPGEDLRIPLKHMGDLIFPHSRHTGAPGGGKAVVGAGLSCGDCHPGLFARDAGALLSMPVPHTSGACATCHNGKTRSPAGRVAAPATGGCSKCHLPGIQGSKS